MSEHQTDGAFDEQRPNMIVQPKIKRTYYTVDVPRDFSDDADERFDVAVNEARERAATYVLPCRWRLVWDRGDAVRVCREHR